jgi:hypothetical protein
MSPKHFKKMNMPRVDRSRKMVVMLFAKGENIRGGLQRKITLDLCIGFPLVLPEKVILRSGETIRHFN